MVEWNRGYLVNIHARILVNNTSFTTRRRIEELPIKPTHHIREPLTAVRAYSNVFAPHTVDDGCETVHSGFVGIFGEDVGSILEEGGHLCRFVTWSRRHVEDVFVWLRVECDNGQEGQRGLECPAT